MDKYKILAAGYDLIDKTLFEEKGLNPRRVMGQMIPDENRRVLDLCCGTFSNGYSIACKNPRNKIMGIDLSKQMLKGAKRKVSKAGLTNVRLKYGDATDTKLKGESFDDIVIGLVLHECAPDLRKGILTEAYRLLKPEGKLVVLEWERPDSLFRRIKYSPLYLGEMLGCRSFREFYLCDKRKFLREHGFEVKEWHHCNYSCVIVAQKIMVSS